MRLKKAFTLIELLVVIAIIAILAAIIFPVMAKAKEAAFRSGDLANMNTLRSALQLYRIDQGGYPPALLGYVTTYTPGGTDVIPAGKTRGFLSPKRIDSITTFQPAYNRFKDIEVTTAVWPNKDIRTLGEAPIVDTDGDGKITNADDNRLEARQAFESLDGPVCAGNVPCANQPSQLQFYKMSGYDVSLNDKVIPNRFELRYTLFFTTFALVGVSGQLGSALDDPRQLGYADPPETTPITWNGYFRDYNAGVLSKGKRDIVLFLGGAAKPYASNLVVDQAWRIMP